MSTVYGTNATLRDNSFPAQKVAVGEERGRVRMAYDEYVLTTTVPPINSSIELMEIPAGARVVGATLFCDDLGSVGVIDVGWEASADGVEAASQAGLFASVDVHTAALVSLMSGLTTGAAGLFKKFASKVRVVAKNTTAWDATSGKIRLEVRFVLD